MKSHEVHTFQKDILDWYEIHKRNLPWRDAVIIDSEGRRDPYAILISEIMLQQTQVNRVIPKYITWMQSFPTVNDLAEASVSEVLAHWSGLGYNRRALNLKKTAEIIVNTFHGTIPQTEAELLQLPGIGIYTARALLCFAFQKQIAVVDINVKKVILTKILHRPNATDKEITFIAEKLLPAGKAYIWNQALMDYSRTVLKNQKIVIPKQSKFKGSHRYYRGRILKELINRNKIPLDDLGICIKKNYKEVDAEWLRNLLSELENEGFVIVDKGVVSFPENKS